MAEHHYIPKFYLKGFTSTDTESFYIYDVSKGKFKLGQYTVRSHFFEIDRNSVEHQGQLTDLPEKMYGKFENDEAKLLRRLKNEDKPVLSFPDMIILCRFLAVLYLRIPTFDEIYKFYYSSNDAKALGISVKDENGQNAPSQILDKIKNTPLFEAAFRPTLGLNLVWDTAKKENFQNWYFIPTAGRNLISDNPIFWDQKAKSINFMLRSFAIPITKKTTLVKTERSIAYLNSVKPRLNLLIDICTFNQAKKFVACADKQYLELIFKLASSNKREAFENELLGILNGEINC